MIPDDDKISNFQAALIVFNFILGAGVFMFPSEAAKNAGNDAWMTTIVAGLINILLIYIICKGGGEYSRYGFVGTCRVLFGRIFGTILAIPVFLYFIYAGGMTPRLFAEVIKLFLLHNTPIEFVIIPLILLGVILVRSGIEPMARFFEVLLPLTIFLVVVLVVTVLPGSDFTNLRPFFSGTIPGYLKGILSTSWAYAGFEILLVIYPFMRSPGKAFKSSAVVMLAMTLLYALVVMLCIVRLGVEETKTLLFAPIYIIKASEAPIGLVERFEGLVMALWVILEFTTFVVIAYGISVTGGDLLNQKDRKHILPIIMPLLLIFGLQGESTVDFFKIVDNIRYLQTYTVVIIPLVILLTVFIKKKVGKKSES
ncbi:MAG: hypothetical protein FIA99_19435 [Ruminiclostridium sp.]|nr:hypothetical protein [Ruminiclostridium sp.]